MGQKIAVIGTGYVGLTTGACLAHLGHDVVCADVDAEKVDAPEPGRDPHPRGRPRRAGPRGHRRPASCASCSAPPTRSPTPSSSTSACPRPRAATARPTCATSRRPRPRSARTWRPESVVINKSTVPVGSTRVVEQALGRSDVHVVSNPEFLREGSAVHDFLNPDRVVIGADDQAAAIRVAGLYLGLAGPAAWSPIRPRPRPSSTPPTPSSPPRSASSTPSPRCARRSAPTSTTWCWAWATTSASATRSSAPAPAGAGRCFPKDSHALVKIAEDAGYDFDLLKGVITVNDEQFERVADKIEPTAGGSLDGAPVAVWGLTFKARTDDLRDSPSLEIIDRLRRRAAPGSGPTTPRSRPAPPTPASTASRSSPTPTRPATAPRCWPSSPSGTSSSGSTSTRWPTSWRPSAWSTAATCSTATRCVRRGFAYEGIGR